MKRMKADPRRSQRGAATLIVVMVLFFIISLVAGYTSRNLIFEQRTSANQYRSTQALEAAEAGLEWAITLLNFGRITSACIESTNPADTSFRQRYLNIDGVTGKITPDPNPAGGDLAASCVFNGARWDCSCPSTGSASPTAPTGAGVFPAFRVQFLTIPGDSGSPTVPRQPGAVRVRVVGCTRLDAVSGEQCLTFIGQGATSEGRVVVTSTVALAGSAVALPQAALTAFGPVNVGGAALAAYNTRPDGSGITIHSSGAIATAGLVLRSSPGSPWASSLVQNDTALTLAAAAPFTAAERTFASLFNMRPETFRTQQAAVELTCTPCGADAVRTALAANPGRPLWLNGSLVVDSVGDIGSAAEPALLVINGDLQFDAVGAAVNLSGLVYTKLPALAINWVTSGAGQVTGAVVAEGGVGGTGTPTIVYDSTLLTRLRFNTGSFVRVPSSWRDYQ